VLCLITNQNIVKYNRPVALHFAKELKGQNAEYPVMRTQLTSRFANHILKQNHVLKVAKSSRQEFILYSRHFHHAAQYTTLLRSSVMAETSCSDGADQAEIKALPKLTPAEFENYNRLAVMMENFVRFSHCLM